MIDVASYSIVTFEHVHDGTTTSLALSCDSTKGISSLDNHGLLRV